MWVKNFNRWTLSLLLLIPVLLLNLSHFLHRSDQKIPSFFLQDDMPYYMAVAHEYFDTGNSPLSYGNPFSPEIQTKRHYFQPITFLLAVLLQFTQIDPGILFMAFGVILGLLAIRTSVALFEYLHPLLCLLDLLFLLFFIWGGGLLSVGGTCFSLFTNHNTSDWLIFDPSGGWWFLNLGRNFIYPLESLYHLLFFVGVFFAIRKKWGLALASAFLLSISHPFTGLQFLLILNAWLLLEKVVGDDPPTLSISISGLLILVSHLAYYLLYLGGDPEHRSVMEAWKINFKMHELTFLLSLFPLFFLFWWGIRLKKYPITWLLNSTHRFLLVGFLTTLGLVFHDRVINPIQPLHFDRGYLWTFLFLIALPGLKAFFRSLQKNHLAPLSIALFSTLILSDNSSWFTAHILNPTGYYHTPPQKEVLDWFNQHATDQDLLVSEDRIMTYLAPTYSSIRPWYAFYWFTPYAEQNIAEQKKFFETGEIPDRWKGRSILVLQPRAKTASKIKFKKLKLFENADYRIWQIRP